MTTPTATEEPLILGVRHHSPACARVVADEIRRVRPAYVLIEGPADMNDRIGELLLDHRLPLAIFSFLAGDGVHHGSWTPFTDGSPEWQALTVGSEVGAEVRFCDLPAWHPAMSDVTDRYAEGDEARGRAEAYETELARHLGADDIDAVWDTLFEDTAHVPTSELAARLRTHFDQLRADDPGSAGNGARESMMSRWTSWAMAQRRGPVVVVCGGYHAPAIAERWRAMPAALPEIEGPEEAYGVGEWRHGSYLVPYSDQRLDAFAGYGAGMPSPGYQHAVWTMGPDLAGQELVRAVLDRLRTRKLPASTAHVVAIHTRAHALARLRGHHDVLRTDWLDGLAGALVDDALDAPLPWSYRGPLRAGTDPVLVETVAVLAGSRIGRLHPETPQPPLLASVQAELDALGLRIPGDYRLDLLDADDQRRSQVLHRLLLLTVPGMTRQSGPALALGGDPVEQWQLRTPRDQAVALIEASAYGAGLEQAATARLAELLTGPDAGVDDLAEVLNAAAFAGLADVQADVLPRIEAAVARERQLEALGRALAVLHPLSRHGHWLPIAGGTLLASVLRATIDRAAWLLEPAAAVPPGEVSGHLRTVAALRDVTRDALLDPDSLPGVHGDRLVGVLRRKAADEASDPTSRGAALGALVSLAALDDDDGVTEALALLARLPADRLGDALAGLLALGREALATTSAFVVGVDGLVRSLGADDFVVALPALRHAFGYLPPRERGAVADEVVRLHGGSSRRSVAGPLTVNPEVVARGGAAEERALVALVHWGVLDEQEVRG